jgi:hypothetical protein
VSEEQLKEFREHERTGRVLGDEDFQKRLEKEVWAFFAATDTGSQEGCKGVVVYAVPGSPDAVPGSPEVPRLVPAAPRLTSNRGHPASGLWKQRNRKGHAHWVMALE